MITALSKVVINLIKKGKFANGFTLLEALILVALASTASVILVNILLNNTRVTTSQDNFVNVGVELNSTLSKLSLDLREASEVALSYIESPGTTTFSDSSHIVLKLQALKADGSVNLVKYDYLVISAGSISPKVLQERVYPDVSSFRPAGVRNLTPYLDAITFEYLDASSVPTTANAAKRVKVTLSVKSKTGQIGSTTSSTTIVTLRNSQ